MDRYAVMGNPVAHSLSPAIHSAFAAQTGQSLEYTAIPVELDGFEAAVEHFFHTGGSGLNVTVPFKQEAWALAQERSADAEVAGAVNTLLTGSTGKLHGYNTDGLGLVRDIQVNHGGTLAGKDILVLGAGGATRGILLPLLREKPRSVLIANRTAAKAEDLANMFSFHGNVRACGLEALEDRQADWVINATSASLRGELPALPAGLLKTAAWCYDLMYGPSLTPFCRWAQQTGAEKVMDGLGMLVEQAAESFSIWRGVRPVTLPVIQSLRQARQSGSG